MKTRITLILLTAFALCSCLGGQQNPDNSMNIRKKEPYQDASFVLAQMCHWDNLVFEDGEWKVIEMTKSEIEESWYDGFHQILHNKLCHGTSTKLNVSQNLIIRH